MSTETPVVNRTETGQLTFWCPGCECAHGIWTKDSRNPVTNAAWEFNGDFIRPTISPSVLVRGTRDITDDEHSRIMAGEKIDIPDRVCHSFVRDGRIQFLADCTHSLAGKTVDMEPL